MSERIALLEESTYYHINMTDTEKLQAMRSSTDS